MAGKITAPREPEISGTGELGGQGDADGSWQRSQEEQAASHTAPMCPEHKIARAICGCESD